MSFLHGQGWLDWIEYNGEWIFIKNRWDWSLISLSGEQSFFLNTELLLITDLTFLYLFKVICCNFLYCLWSLWNLLLSLKWVSIISQWPMSLFDNCFKAFFRYFFNKLPKNKILVEVCLTSSKTLFRVFQKVLGTPQEISFLSVAKKDIELIRIIWYVKLHGKHCQMGGKHLIIFYG